MSVVKDHGKGYAMPDTQYEFLLDRLPEEAILMLRDCARKRWKAIDKQDDLSWAINFWEAHGILLGLSYAGVADFLTLQRFETKLSDTILRETKLDEEDEEDGD